MSRMPFGALAGFVCLACLTFALSQRPVRAGEGPPTKEIKLGEIFSTSIQEGMKDLHTSLKEDSPERRHYAQIAETLGEQKSPPCLAVLRGETIREAVTAAARWVAAKQPKDEIFGPDAASKSKRYWLFVYINRTSSEPPMWLIQPPTVTGITVRFSYTKQDEGFKRTTDSYPYLYLVPLVELGGSDPPQAELVFLEKHVKATFPGR
jgi:hypothetical protein